MKKVSVIIPCYNAQNVLHYCMNSLENQTIGMDALEILFVNDASTDNTYEVLCEFEKKYPESVMVINCGKNGKQGTARNIAICYASADYIGYMDCDDILEPNMYERMYEAAEKYQPDMVVCKSRRCSLQEYEQINKRPTERNNKSKDWLIKIENKEERLIFLNNDYNMAVWNKLFKKSVLMENQIVFLQEMFYEDIYFTHISKRYLNTIYGVEEILYNHIEYAGSSSINDNREVKEDYIKAQILAYREIKKRNLYKGYEVFYDATLIYAYCTYIHFYTIMFEHIPIHHWNKIRGMILDNIENDIDYSYIEKNAKNPELVHIILKSLKNMVTKANVIELAQYLSIMK